MSTDLEETFNCIFDGRVPPLWVKVAILFLVGISLDPKNCS